MVLYRSRNRKWKFSSVGRVPALQAGCHRFESYNFHHLREWLRGRALPCQGEGRGSESRFPLHSTKANISVCLIFLKGRWHHSQAVRQRSAKPSSPVRFWVVPPTICRCGGIGRRKGLKIPRSKRAYRFKSGHRHQKMFKSFDLNIFLLKNFG